MSELLDQQLLAAVNELTDQVRLSRKAAERATKFQEQLLIRIAPELEKSHLIQMENEALDKRRAGLKRLSSRPKSKNPE
mgnify:CR=1 FL=1|jgi:hypothetical protein